MQKQTGKIPQEIMLESHKVQESITISKHVEVSQEIPQSLTQKQRASNDGVECAVNDLAKEVMNLILKSLNVRLDGTIGRQFIVQFAQKVAKSMKPLARQNQCIIDHSDLRVFKQFILSHCPEERDALKQSGVSGNNTAGRQQKAPLQ